MRPTTIKDIATRLNVAPSTVSRALQNHPDISPERKKAVLKAAAEMDYYPDSIAQSLKNRRTTTIGVIIPEIKHHFFSAALDGIEDVAYKEGYTILVCKSNEDYDREVLNTRALVSNRIAGLIVSVAQTTNESSHFVNLHKRNIPIVFFDRVCEDVEADKVIADDYQGALAATEHLINSGYKNIAHLAGPSHISISRERERGYKDALQKYNVPIKEEYLVHGGLDEEDGSSGLLKLRELSNPPDAVFAVNDPVAIGIFIQCRKDGLKIPDDIAIVGFSDNPISSLIDPPLTTIAQPAYEMGSAAASLLFNRIRNQRKGASVVEKFDTKLLIREST